MECKETDKLGGNDIPFVVFLELFISAWRKGCKTANVTKGTGHCSVI